MPIRATVDTSRRRVVIQVDGVVTDEDVAEFRRTVTATPSFAPDFDQLVDMTGVERVDVSFEVRLDLAERSVFSEESRRALVADRPHLMGFARQHALMRSGRLRTDSVRVFASVEEAEDWLTSG